MSNRTASKSSQEVQLEILQVRLAVHGGKLWQLPFSYAGIVALSASLSQSETTYIGGSQLFTFLAFLGFIVLACMYGAYEGYSRTAKFMGTLEKDMGLRSSTAVGLTFHVVPYFALAFACIGAAIYASRLS